MRISTSLFTFVVLAVIGGTAWALWPETDVQPPATDAASSRTTPKVAVGKQAVSERHDAIPAPTGPVAAPATARDPIAENNPDYRPVIAVQGIVRDAVSQAGLLEANLAHLRSNRKASTGEDGTFLLRLPIDEDGAVLLVTRAGYAAQHVQVLPGDCCDEQAEVQIDLQPSHLFGQITGRVLDDARQPLANCPVELLATLRDSPLTNKATVTDKDGRFRLLDVAAGMQRIAIHADHHDDFVVNDIELQPRMTKDIGTITLKQYQWASIRGQIVDHQGEAVEGVGVIARTAKDDHGAARAITDAEGAFHLPRVAPGSVTMFFDCRGQWAGLRHVELQPRESSTQRVRVPVGPNFIGGEVLVGGAPAHGYSADCELPAAHLEAYGLESFHRSVAVGKDGRFRIDGLIGDAVQLTFTRARPWQSLGLDNALATNRLDHSLSFSAATSTIKVRGFVRDALGTPIAGATIRPHDLHSKTERGISGADGHYQLEMASSAYAHSSLHATHPEFLRTVRRVPSWDSVETKIDFVLDARKDAAKLTIKAQHKGSAIPRALIIIRRDDGQFVARGTTDSRGQHSFELGAGTCKVHVRHPDFRTRDLSVKLTANGGRNLPVLMESQPRFSRILEVRTDPDQPLANTTVTAWQKGAWVAAGKTNALGRATLSELPYGNIVFTVQPDGHARHALLQDVRWEEEAPVMFRIRRGLQSITGTVYAADQRPAALCEVTCESKSRDGGHVRTYATTDAEGRFQIDHLVDGDYELLAYVGDHLIKRTTSPDGTPVVLRVE